MHLVFRRRQHVAVPATILHGHLTRATHASPVIRSAEDLMIVARSQSIAAWVALMTSALVPPGVGAQTFTVTRAAIGGGGLPRVNSGRKEAGSTVYVEQIHGDASMALTYAATQNLVFDIGPRLTYFFQHETSHHQKDSAFELVDVGLRAGMTLKF